MLIKAILYAHSQIHDLAIMITPYNDILATITSKWSILPGYIWYQIKMLNIYSNLFAVALYEISTGKKKNSKSMEMLGVSLP